MQLDIPDDVLKSALTEATQRALVGYDGITERVINGNLRDQLRGVLAGAFATVLADPALEAEIAAVVRQSLLAAVGRRTEAAVKAMPAPAFKAWAERVQG